MLFNVNISVHIEDKHGGWLIQPFDTYTDFLPIFKDEGRETHYIYRVFNSDPDIIYVADFPLPKNHRKYPERGFNYWSKTDFYWDLRDQRKFDLERKK